MKTLTSCPARSIRLWQVSGIGQRGRGSGTPGGAPQGRSQGAGHGEQARRDPLACRRFCRLEHWPRRTPFSRTCTGHETTRARSGGSRKAQAARSGPCHPCRVPAGCVRGAARVVHWTHQLPSPPACDHTPQQPALPLPCTLAGQLKQPGAAPAEMATAWVLRYGVQRAEATAELLTFLVEVRLKEPGCVVVHACLPCPVQPRAAPCGAAQRYAPDHAQ